MEAYKKDGFGILFWFVVTVLLVQHYLGGKHEAVGGAALLWGLAWLTTRVVGSALSRLGERGWMPLLLLLAVGGLFIWLAPYPTGAKVLAVWGIGTPLLLFGMGARTVHDWITARETDVAGWLGMVAASLFVWLPPLFWWNDDGFLAGIVAAFLLSLAFLPLHCGWALGEQARPEDRDARFADTDDFRKRGMSDDL